MKIIIFLTRVYNALSRKAKRWFFRVMDIIAITLALYFTFSLRFDLFTTFDVLGEYKDTLILMIPVKLIVFQLLGVYKTITKYTGLEFLSTVSKAVVTSTALILLISFSLGYQRLPHSITILDAALSFIFIVYLRIFIRWLTHRVLAFEHNTKSRSCNIIIYGAGKNGSQLIQSLKSENSYNPVAFVDDDKQLQKLVLGGLTVYPPDKIPYLIERYSVKEVILAIPNAGRSQKKLIVERLQKLKVTVKTIPGVADLISGKVSVNEIRNVDIVDLLGRKEVLPQPELLHRNIKNKIVMVTGAGGSIGSELCRQICQQGPELLVLFERSEFALYQIDHELKQTYPKLKIIPCLGSVTDSERVNSILKIYSVETIYHAAAYKHVPLVELNPTQGVINNINGTYQMAKAAVFNQVETFVLISTDKAVRPTNLMGATKRIAEQILQGMVKRNGLKTRFTMVRFGNVLDSAGSVVPLFRKQIAAGGPITLTHKDITRYFMSIPEASRLVIQAGAMGKGGDVFLLDMGEPVKIHDLATQMIELSGLEPEADIEIKITGLRPGEKLYEELLIDGDNIKKTDHPKIYGADESMLPLDQFFLFLDQLIESAQNYELETLLKTVQKMVPEYNSQLDLDKCIIPLESTEINQVI